MTCSAFLLGQATPDPRDLSGAQGEDPTLEQRGARCADRLCAGDPTSPGTRALCVRAEERPVAHSVAGDRRPAQGGPARGTMSIGISGTLCDTRWFRGWRDPVGRVGRARHRAAESDRDCHAPPVAFSCVITRLASFSAANGPAFLAARTARGNRSPGLSRSLVSLAAFRATPPRPGDGNG